MLLWVMNLGFAGGTADVASTEEFSSSNTMARRKPGIGAPSLSKRGRGLL